MFNNKKKVSLQEEIAKLKSDLEQQTRTANGMTRVITSKEKEITSLNDKISQLKQANSESEQANLRQEIRNLTEVKTKLEEDNSRLLQELELFRKQEKKIDEDAKKLLLEQENLLAWVVWGRGQCARIILDLRKLTDKYSFFKDEWYMGREKHSQHLSEVSGEKHGDFPENKERQEEIARELEKRKIPAKKIFHYELLSKSLFYFGDIMELLVRIQHNLFRLQELANREIPLQKGFENIIKRSDEIVDNFIESYKNHHILRNNNYKGGNISGWYKFNQFALESFHKGTAKEEDVAKLNETIADIISQLIKDLQKLHIILNNKLLGAFFKEFDEIQPTMQKNLNSFTEKFLYHITKKGELFERLMNNEDEDLHKALEHLKNSMDWFQKRIEEFYKI